MIEIEKDGNAVRSRATCDKCGNGYKWDKLIGVTKIERILRKEHSWSFGKEHICGECKKVRWENNGNKV